MHWIKLIILQGIISIMGHREFFLSLSRDGRGFWIRFLLSEKYESIPSVSISTFTANKTEGIRYIYPHSVFDITRNRFSVSGENIIDLNGRYARGSNADSTYSFDIQWIDNEGKVNAIAGLERILDFRSEYILYSPSASFDGHIRYMGNDYNLNGYRGMVGYISQPDYLNRWTWAHISGSDQDDEMWADLLVTGIRMMGRNISLFSARIDGDLIKAHIMPLTFRGNADINGIHGSVNTKNGSVAIDGELDRQRTIKAKYDNVRKYDRYCYNSEIADISLKYHGRDFTSMSGFLEHGTGENIEGFVEIVDKQLV